LTLLSISSNLELSGRRQGEPLPPDEQSKG
jgi:hypothetical protein